MLEVVMEYYLVGLVVTLLLSIVYLSINLYRDKINMFTDKGDNKTNTGDRIFKVRTKMG
jgi:hypothetical protein